MFDFTPTVGDEASPLKFSRRSLLVASAVSLGALSPLRALAQRELVESGTPQLTLGPFFPLDRLLDGDWDMTRVAGRSDMAKGTIIEVAGMVRSLKGAPVPGARLDVWQTNALGAYHHPSDPSGAPRDPAFQGAAVVRAGSNGQFRIRTVMPTPYGRRQRHIHFDVSGRNRRLITQMFFPGEPNDQDTLFPRIANDAQRAAAVATASGSRDGILLFQWDIVLAGE